MAAEGLLAPALTGMRRNSRIAQHLAMPISPGFLPT
jgi:hypothetical protein